MLGSLMVRNTDAQMQDEEEVGLTVRLAGDTWVDAVDQGGDDTRDLLASLTSAQQEDYGWNAVVKPFLAERADSLNVSRVSDAELTIGIPGAALKPMVGA